MNSLTVRELREIHPSADELLAKILREADRSQAKFYGPPGVLVDAQFEIVHYQGDTNPYLAIYSGRPSTNLLKMCREGMLAHLRICLQQARRSSSSVVTPRMKVYTEDQFQEIVVRVIPVGVPESQLRYYWVMFEPTMPTPAVLTGPTTGTRRGARNKDQQQAIEAQRERILQQSAELRLLREEMQQMQEHQEAAQEELRAANEEILSTNEELMGKNAELVRVQQDLQSANEEQRTLIDELRVRNIALDQANAELSAKEQ